MEGESSTRPSHIPQIEGKKINTLLETNKDSLGEFKIVPVGDSGFIVWNERLKPVAGKDWVLFDYDDTLADYTRTKKERQRLYTEYLRKDLGITISDEDAVKVMEITDKFSRWEHNRGEGEHYHPNAHMSALTWATEQLTAASQEEIKGSIVRVEKILERIKGGVKFSVEQQGGDPFHFEKTKLILHSKVPWSGNVERIFQDTLINPPLFEEAIGSIREIGTPEQSIRRFNVGIFTYGDPYFQLLKVVNLLKKNPDLPITQIWLTRKPKGEFVEEMIKTQAEMDTEMQYVPAELEEYPGESISLLSGHPLGETEHVIIMFDDDPKQLNDLLRSNETLKRKSGAEFVVVRSKQAGTKTENRDWNVASPYGEIDFTSQRYLARDISNIFLINRYLIMRRNRGVNDPVVKSEQYRLAGLGIDTSKIERAR